VDRRDLQGHDLTAALAMPGQHERYASYA
jgi:hypothetical protein